MKVAVIGAGAAGLVCARELQRRHHEVVVFEQSSQVGGVWVYEPVAETNSVTLAASVHSSLYASLRTNLPRDLMAFSDYPFDAIGDEIIKGAQLRYPHHSKVLAYLQNFSRDFNLSSVIQFNTQVISIRSSSDNIKGDLEEKEWTIESINLESNQKSVETFDAVTVCNGHYAIPKAPDLTGLEGFTGKVMHSHNYRDPAAFKDKRVLIIGAASSGADISREVASVAKDVVWSGREFKLPSRSLPDGRRLFPDPVAIEGNIALFGTVGPGSEGADSIESVADIDAILFCTGYQYTFPFLDDPVISVADNWVNPLYKDILPPQIQSIAFIGLPYLVVPFPLFEMQSKWYASLLAGGWQLPPMDDLNTAISEKYAGLAQEGIKQSHYHRLGEQQARYINDLANQCGAKPLPESFHDLTIEAQNARIADPLNFRDRQ